MSGWGSFEAMGVRALVGNFISFWTVFRMEVRFDSVFCLYVCSEILWIFLLLGLPIVFESLNIF